MHFDSSLTLGRHVQNGLKLDSRVDDVSQLSVDDFHALFGILHTDFGWFCSVFTIAQTFTMWDWLLSVATLRFHSILIRFADLQFSKIQCIHLKKVTPIHKASQIIWHHSLYSAGKYDQHDIWRVSVRFCDVLPFQRISFRISLLWFPPFWWWYPKNPLYISMDLMISERNCRRRTIMR